MCGSRLVAVSPKGTVELSRQHNEPEDSRVSHALQLYWKSVENYRRQVSGLPPIPYTQEELQWERELDIKYLNDALPHLLHQAHKSDTEAQELLKLLEQDVNERLKGVFGYPEGAS